jgi:hypothetical protein
MRRRRPLLFALIASGFTAAAIAIACSAPEATKAKPLDTREDEDSGKKKDPPPDPGEITPEQDPPLPDGGAPPGAVYAHTARNLYLFEPISKKLSFVGPFTCLESNDSMIDVALDRDGIMFGTSFNGFLKINTTTGSCEYVKKDPAAQYPNSLSFVPTGTVDPTKETLVGYQYDSTLAGTIYAKIDIATGAISKIGDLNDPNAAVKYKSSGDLIALIRNGNKAFLTVKNLSADSGTGNDLLAEVDPKTGRLIKIINDIKKRDLFGFGFWAGTGYGFNAFGEILEIDMTNATSKVLMTHTEDGGTAAWYGAGVKTFAPTAPTN